VIYLTVTQILFLHMRLVQETGGMHGIRDLPLLESAVARPQATFQGQDLYPGIHAKAAALMHSLVENHPMVDGNKRLGAASAGIFLQLNQWYLTATNMELMEFTLCVAQGRATVDEIAQWLASHSAAQAIE
jgi:death-on-curing protein